MARRIVLTSGKGGVGKTTVCASLGQNLARLGFRTLLIDCDMGLNNLDVALGVQQEPMFDLSDVANGRCRVKQAINQICDEPLLYLLSSSRVRLSDSITGECVKNIVCSLDRMFDFILIDSPAGVDEGFVRAVMCASEAIVVVTPHISSLKDASRVITLLKTFNLSSVSLVINRMRGDMLLSGEMPAVESVVLALKVPLIGVIPEDDQVCASGACGQVLSTKESTRAFTLLSENINNGSKKIYDCTYKYRGVMGYFKRNLKKRV